MKIIDLLNKIANGEEVPKRIYFWDREYELDEYRHYMTYYESTNLYGDMFDKCENGELEDFLNDEVEIIEEKKIPEKLNKQHFHNRQRQLANKINEIIIYLQEKNKND